MPLPSSRRMWIMSKRYPPEQRARAVEIVLDHLDEYRSI
jgi:transposase-like protein